MGRCSKRHKDLPRRGNEKKAKSNPSPMDDKRQKKVESSPLDDNANDTSKEKKTKSTPASMDTKILGVMFGFHMDEKSDATLPDIASQLGVHERAKSFRERWSALKNQKKWIEPTEGSRGCFRLSKEGIDKAATPEYKEMLKELSIKPKTNVEHQERIKKYFKKKLSAQMYDFFLEYGSLSREELESLTGQNRRSHVPHYSWQELQRKRLIEKDPIGKVKGEALVYRLSDKAFLNPKDDRPNTNDADKKKQLQERIASGRALIEGRKKAGGKQTEKKSKGEKKKTKSEDTEIKNEEVTVKEENTDMKKIKSGDTEIKNEEVTVKEENTDIVQNEDEGETEWDGSKEVI